jgi:uncharacterized protein (DUF4415 family)
MKTYDFSRGKRGAVVQPKPGKTRITIRLDSDIVERFVADAEASGGANYQTMINDALRAYVEGRSPTLEAMLRRVIKEEIRPREARV